LAEWAKHKGFEPAKHHLLIINEIESFLEGEDEVLLLFAPPGSAKSTYVSVLLPSWYLAKERGTRFGPSPNSPLSALGRFGGLGRAG
jgi:hypothetical protein